MRPTLLYLIAEDWFFLSHFIDRALAAKAAGYDVIVAAHETGKSQLIRAAGFRFEPLDLERGGLNPLRELRLIRAVTRLYRRERPDIVHHIGLKPLLYGSVAARITGGMAVVNAPVGMGFVFTSETLKSRILRPPLALALRLLLDPPRGRVIFENGDDMGAMIASGTVKPSAAVLIRGAGIDLIQYRPVPEPAGPPVVALVARMLRDKGIAEFVAAATSLKQRGVAARFRLVGDPDPGNPASVSEAQLRDWQQAGAVEWLGFRDDIPAILAESHIACLPSYREGLPKSLLEAMAAGQPVVATDVPGCREAVVEGETGLLVPARDAVALAAALKRLIESPDLRHRMGAAGRKRAETEFSSERVQAETLAVYAALKPQVRAVPSSRPGRL